MSNKNFQPEENEILSRDDEKIRRMLGDLNRVDAPKDFDFRLKARIANSKPQDFQATRLFPILRYAAPLGLAIVILAFFVVNGLFSVEESSVATVDTNVVKSIGENTVSANYSQPEQFVAAVNSQTEDIGNSNSLNKQKKETNPSSKDLLFAANTGKPKSDAPKTTNNGGSSRDEAVKSPDILLPPGFGSNNSFSVKDILSINGIEAELSGKKWTVKSVLQNSSAERLGIKTNDVIEAINDNKISTETITSKGAINVKKLTVARGGEKIEINLQKK